MPTYHVVVQRIGYQVGTYEVEAADEYLAQDYRGDIDWGVFKVQGFDTLDVEQIPDWLPEHDKVADD